MRLVIQRVLEAAVTVDGKEISKTGKGMLVLLGITKTDNTETVDKYVNKLLKIRLWDEIPKKVEEKSANDASTTDSQTSNVEEQKSTDVAPKKLKTWNSNVVDNFGDIMIVSQFTLYGILKGNKPDFHGALGGEEAKVMYDDFVSKLRKQYKPEKIQTGSFGAYMDVHLVNDGPVTLILDSDKDK